MVALEHSKDAPDSGRIRDAIASDAEKLAALINAAFVVEQIAIEGERVDCLGVEKYMHSGKFFVLEGRQGLLGCVYVEQRGDRGYLGLLSVDPAQQKRGLGGLLAREAEKYCRAAGCFAVDLRVISARAELANFYGKLGYVVTGTSPMPDSAPLKVPCHYIHMSKFLEASDEKPNQAAGPK